MHFLYFSHFQPTWDFLIFQQQPNVLHWKRCTVYLVIIRTKSASTELTAEDEKNSVSRKKIKKAMIKASENLKGMRNEFIVSSSERK